MLLLNNMSLSWVVPGTNIIYHRSSTIVGWCILGWFTSGQTNNCHGVCTAQDHPPGHTVPHHFHYLC